MAHRPFRTTSLSAAGAQSDVHDNAASRGNDAATDAAIELVELRERLRAADDAIRMRDDAARMSDETIADLRRRLDVATEQLGEALTQVRQLTDQRSTVPATPVIPEPTPRRWWRWGQR